MPALYLAAPRKRLLSVDVEASSAPAFARVSREAPAPGQRRHPGEAAVALVVRVIPPQPQSTAGHTSAHPQPMYHRRAFGNFGPRAVIGIAWVQASFLDVLSRVDFIVSGSHFHYYYYDMIIKIGFYYCYSCRSDCSHLMLLAASRARVLVRARLYTPTRINTNSYRME